jgi:formylglycine-generating enzyme required for sulfatase activity
MGLVAMGLAAAVSCGGGAFTGGATDGGAGALDGGADGTLTTDGAPLDDGEADRKAGEGGGNPCPSGRGPLMQRIGGGGRGGFCIDATEVTNAQFALFLASQPDAGGQPTCCAFNTAFTPGGTWPRPAAEASLPVVNVNWCDALGYCQWAGKRLCGARGDGGVVPLGGATNAQASEWFAACSRDGTRSYPYGSTFQAGICNTNGGPGRTADAGAFTGCEGDKVYDLVGNVLEWENACNGCPQDGGVGSCALRGGAYGYPSNGDVSCTFAEGFSRDFRTGDVGFRCCAD